MQVLPVSTTTVAQSPFLLDRGPPETGERIKRHETPNITRIAAAPRACAVRSRQRATGWLDLVVQQIEIMGARQWLGLMAGSVIAPVSQRGAGGFFHSPTPAHPDRTLNPNAPRANDQPPAPAQRTSPKSPE